MARSRIALLVIGVRSGDADTRVGPPVAVVPAAERRKPKLSSQQLTHAHRLIEDGQRREDVAALFKVSRVTLYRALAGDQKQSGG